MSTERLRGLAAMVTQLVLVWIRVLAAVYTGITTIDAAGEQSG